MTTAVCQPAIDSGVSVEPIWGLELRCPRCGGLFEWIAQPRMSSSDRLRCCGCFFVLRSENGIWLALPEGREAYSRRLKKEYQSVRTARGRLSCDPAYRHISPHQDYSGRDELRWRVRERALRYLQHELLPPLESACPRGMKILDLGAGNGWLSHRLTLRGHRPVAIDVFTDLPNGLEAAGVFRKSQAALYPRFEAELEHLPFAKGQFDLAIFNSSLRCSEDYVWTLGEAMRCLRPKATIIIADAAWYSAEQSGMQMLAERCEASTSHPGIASDGLSGLNGLTEERLRTLEGRLGLRWEAHSPFLGLDRVMRPILARLQGRGELPKLRIYVAEVRK